MRDALMKVVQTVVNSGLGDLPVTVTLRSTVTGTYNPETGAASRVVSEIVLKAVLTNITQKDTNDLELLTSGKKVLLAGADLDGVELDALDDTVIINLDKYQLKSHKMDPAGALYSLMVIKRSPK